MKQLVMNAWGKIVPLVLIVGLTLAMACSTSTDPEPEPPIEPQPIEKEGTKELTVIIVDRAEESGLTGYDIEITGPVSASAENVSTSEYVLENLESGEYTIEVTLDGYVDASITEEFEVPEAVSADYLAEATVSLRVLTPPVKVDNTQPTTVQTGKPDDEDATEDEAVTLQIPANTFPAEVVNADGTVDISVTRSRPSESKAGESGGQVSESLILSPTAELNDTITVTVPIRDIQGLEGVEYVLQPGDIPLTSDNNGNLTAKIAPQSSSLLIDTEAELTEFATYSIVATNVEVTKTTGTTTPLTIASACGEPLAATYTKAAVEINEAIKKYSVEAVDKSKAISKAINEPAITNRIVSVDVSNSTITYTLTVDDETAATVTVNENIISVTDPTESACHGS